MSDDESIKVIVVGDGNVGKTCMLRRFVRGEFIEQYRKTIGAEFLEKDVFLRSSNTTVKLMLWDTAGQEVFNSLTQAYYRGAGAAILCFSTVDRDSFMNIQNWKQRVESVCGAVTTVLCQTKFDLSHEAVVTNEEAEGLASSLSVPLFRVSTKDDFNVTQLFEFAAQQSIEAGMAPSSSLTARNEPTAAETAPAGASTAAPAAAPHAAKGAATTGATHNTNKSNSSPQGSAPPAQSSNEKQNRNSVNLSEGPAEDGKKAKKKKKSRCSLI